MAGKALGRLSAIKALAAKQTAILRDLKDIFGRAVPDLNHQSIHSNRYTRSMVRVPVLSSPAERTKGPANRTRGQMSYVVATIETILEERRQFSVEIAEIFETIRKTQATVCPVGVC